MLATISFATGDMRAGNVMTLMVTIGVLLRFVQKSRADPAAVLRAGKELEIPLRHLVPGDVVVFLAAAMP